MHIACRNVNIYEERQFSNTEELDFLINHLASRRDCFLGMFSRKSKKEKLAVA